MQSEYLDERAWERGLRNQLKQTQTELRNAQVELRRLNDAVVRLKQRCKQLQNERDTLKEQCPMWKKILECYGLLPPEETPPHG